ncbi:ABC transporter substrate-binding protein [uncultured Limimaricola sp.]|uniref:ABC transporter substrate-binding protein n=1 Tax=uncultured Limimaricola sp. TaxID=2211667 RepID=UPI0030F567A8
MIRHAVRILALGLWTSAAQAGIEVPVTWLRTEVVRPPVRSNLDTWPEDEGRAGAELGLEDNATTGRFLGHDYSLYTLSVPPDGNLVEVAKAALARGGLLILDAPADAALTVADLPEAQGALIFNTAAPEARLRGADCRANLLHTLPSTAMRTDALAQFLLQRRWDDLVMIAGARPEDVDYADSLRGSLTKFGLKLRAEAPWLADADIRRNAGQEVPVFTQSLPDHDVLLVADEAGDFARYVAYNAWTPRPLAGSEGLRAVAWAPVVEAWGAAQLQSRFHAQSGREMRPRDFAAWAAMRAIGEAVTRTGSADPATLRVFLLGPEFELGGFLGSPLSFRSWDGQMRQPIPLVTERAVVATAPLEGFLHPVSEMDTLGGDAPETTCTAFEDTA